MNRFPKDKLAPGELIEKVRKLFKTALSNSTSYLIKAPANLSINLEAALLVHGILEFFLNQFKLVQTPEEKEQIDKYCIRPLQTSLSGQLVSIFLNSALAWKPKEPLKESLYSTSFYIVMSYCPFYH